MNKKVKQTLLPKLRFPAFQNAEGWEKKELRPFLERYVEKVKSNTSLSVFSSSREGLLPQNEYYRGNKVINDGEYGVVPEGYIVYRHMSDDITFKFNINDNGRPIAVSKEYPVFWVNGLDPVFLRYLLNESRAFKDFAAMQRKGGTRTRLYFETLCSWKAPLPTMPEQKKISCFLSSIDKLIESEENELKARQKYKVGLVQQLFPLDGENLPTLRFPEYRGAPEWSLHNGNQLFDPISNKDHDSDLPVLAITQEHGAIPREKINYHVSVSEKSIESYKVVEVGDFIISLRSFQGGIEYSEYKGLCSPAYVILRKRKDFVSEYFKHYFKAGTFIQDLNKNIEGLRDGKMVSYKQFSDLLLPLPPSRDEQQKIATCLTLIDEIIAQQSKKLEVLQKQKDGLMQLLFPSDVEMIA
tara:strand:- start:4666 stop:5901 length:1236 start_codon:yes stop_codon:yes gene_type:complete